MAGQFVNQASTGAPFSPVGVLYVSTVSLIGTDLLAESNGASTLTCTYTVTEGANGVTLNANAVSSLTQTTLAAQVQSISNGTGVTVAVP